MITINKIAKLAGVSRGTVDRVINKRGGVSRVVEERVAGVIEQYGYKPNKVAQALVKSKKSHCIGVISTSGENIFFREVIRGIRRAARELRWAGISVRFREAVKFSVADQLRRLDEVLDSGVDALVINPIDDPQIRKRLREAAAGGMPIVTFNCDIEGVDRLAYIGCDYRKSGRIAAGLISVASGGAAGTAVVVGSLKNIGDKLRVDGMREELRFHPGMRIAEIVETNDDDITSYSRVRALLEANGGINAFFFAAAGKEGGIRAILDARRERMPIIVTVDFDPFTAKCLKDGTVLATVCQQPFVQGYEPVRQLGNYLLVGDRPARRVQYTQAEIVIRQSLDR